MKKLALVLACATVMVIQPAAALPQEQEPIKHGGKIETKYDGFNHETVMRLRRMKVNCDGFKDKFKDACVSIEVALHCPGTQLNYVKHVTVQVIFENKDWVRFHAPDQRDLSAVTDTETLRLGRMAPSAKRPGTWDTKEEMLELTIPYAMFKKMAQSQTLEIQVGRDSVELRKNNVAALKDLDSRVLPPRTSATTAPPK
jgi:hypothetical protein